MIEGFAAILPLAAREALLFAATLFCVIGAEDFAFDLIWIANAVRTRMRPFRGSADGVTATRTVRFAILVPAWDEATVIGSMIDGTRAAYQDQDVTIFVGAYPNDPATLAVLGDRSDQRLVIAVNPRAGPTSKGDALNTAWTGLVEHERLYNVRFDLVVMHDAEDVVSRFEPDVFAAHARQHDFMQIPVVPVPVRSSRWIAGHYCDEFAEAHVKSLVVRELLNVSIPSAGVGTAIDRNLLERIATARGGQPFSPDSLTEDYELGLVANALGATAAFLRTKEPVTGEIVCVRSRFPEQLSAATRQKSRWIAGIAFAGWDRMGWTASVREIWVRWRDRRALFEAAALVAGYGGLMLAAAAALQFPQGASLGGRWVGSGAAMDGRCVHGVAAGGAGGMHILCLWVARGPSIAAARHHIEPDRRAGDDKGHSYLLAHADLGPACLGQDPARFCHRQRGVNAGIPRLCPRHDALDGRAYRYADRGA